MNNLNFVSHCKTGDILAFGGYSIFSKLIKWKTHSEISHVGVILQNQKILSEYHEPIFIESTALTRQRDCILGEAIKGVQIHLMTKRILEYEGDIWWYPLHKQLESEKESHLIEVLSDLHTKRIKYDFAQAVGSGCDIFDCLLSNKNDHKSLFCSELVGIGYKSIGLLSVESNPSELTPADIVHLPLFQERKQIKSKRK